MVYPPPDQYSAGDNATAIAVDSAGSAYVTGAAASTDFPTTPGSALPSHAAPTVRLELRHGSARSVVYDVPGEEFVLGSAPGCDLRLPGTNLPPEFGSKTPHTAMLPR